MGGRCGVVCPKPVLHCHEQKMEGVGRDLSPLGQLRPSMRLQLSGLKHPVGKVLMEQAVTDWLVNRVRWQERCPGPWAGFDLMDVLCLECVCRGRHVRQFFLSEHPGRSTVVVFSMGSPRSRCCALFHASDDSCSCKRKCHETWLYFLGTVSHKT